jgi:pimeloyl-ACP methyl ester carboxylesterase
MRTSARRSTAPTGTNRRSRREPATRSGCGACRSVSRALRLHQGFSETDLTEDLKKIDVPTLVAHGDDDQIVSIVAAAERSSTLVPDSTLKVYPGAPNGLSAVGPFEDEFNSDLMEVIRS